MKTITRFDGEYRFLSNFCSLAPIEYEGILYETVENAFQAAKFADGELRLRLSRMSPTEAKKEGRRHPLRKDWESVKTGIMEELVRKKFRQPRMRRMLLDTGDAELVEGNTWGDTFWGVDIRTGRGRNALGKILMKIRTEINNETDK